MWTRRAVELRCVNALSYFPEACAALKTKTGDVEEKFGDQGVLWFNSSAIEENLAFVFLAPGNSHTAHNSYSSGSCLRSLRCSWHQLTAAGPA